MMQMMEKGSYIGRELSKRASETRGSGGNQQLTRSVILRSEALLSVTKGDSQGFAATAAHAISLHGRFIEVSGGEGAHKELGIGNWELGFLSVPLSHFLCPLSSHIDNLHMLPLPRLSSPSHTINNFAPMKTSKQHAEDCYMGRRPMPPMTVPVVFCPSDASA